MMNYLNRLNSLNRTKKPIISIPILFMLLAGIIWMILSGGRPAQAALEGGADPIFLSYTFSSNDLNLTDLGDYDRVDLEGTGCIGKENEPFLPVKNVRLSLPLGFDASQISVFASNEVQYNNLEKPLLPGSRPLAGVESQLPSLFEGEVYSKDALYPDTIAELIPSGSISGYPMAQIAIYPVRYNPVQQTMVLYQQIDIQLDLAPSSNPGLSSWAIGSGPDDPFRDMVQSLVENPDDVPSHEAQQEPEVRSRESGAPLEPPVEYLIITDPAFVDEFQRLADWKIKKGVWTEIITTDYIDQNYGTGDPKYIRNCIIDYKNLYGRDFVYVLLGGDKSIIDCRCPFVNVTVNNPNRPALEYQYPPSDLYYSALEGTWDGDHDQRFGEYPDDNQNEQLDWYSDVFVGRAPVDTLDQARVFVDKVLLYEGEGSAQPLPLDYLKKLQFIAGWMDNYTYCRILKNQIDDGYVNLNGITNFDVLKHYLKLKDIVSEALDTGKNVVNHAGHGWICGVQTNSNSIPLYLSSDDISTLSNSPRLTAVMYSTSCYSAAFDEPSLQYLDSFGELFTLAPNGGGTAYIGNSRYGFYWSNLPNPSYPDFAWDTLSNWYDQAFFRCLYHPLYDRYHLGIAFAFGRQSYGPYFTPQGDVYTRCCMYEQNLLGDPEMPIIKSREHSEPDTMSLDHPNTVRINPFGAKFKVTVTLGSNGTLVEGAHVCLWKEGEVFAEAETDDKGEAKLEVIATSTGTMYVTATKNDLIPSQSNATVLEQKPLIADRHFAYVFDKFEIVNFALNAQHENAMRLYFLLGTMSGTSPGFDLPSGVTLPLNQDFFMDYIVQNPFPPMFTGFVGQLDENGEAMATFAHQALFTNLIGETLHFAYYLADPKDYASNAVPVHLTDIAGGVDPQ